MAPDPAADGARLAHAMLRVTLGVNIFLHGVVRLPKLDAFVSAVVTQFSGTVLPPWLVGAYAASLPFAEAAVGLLILLGLWLRSTLLVGASIMVSLVFGTALREQWNTLAVQMLYALIYYVLLRDLGNDAWSIDRLRARR